MNDLYAPPSSDLSKIDHADISVFERFSTWYVIGLTIVTLSLYLPYWLYTRSKSLNAITENKISSYFINVTLILFFTSIVAVVTVEFIQPDETIMLTSSALDLISNIMMLVWVFKFRNRLSELFSHDSIKLGPVMTFFFQVFYLQYKINEIIDHKKILQRQA